VIHSRRVHPRRGARCRQLRHLSGDARRPRARRHPLGPGSGDGDRHGREAPQSALPERCRAARARAPHVGPGRSPGGARAGDRGRPQPRRPRGHGPRPPAPRSGGDPGVDREGNRGRDRRPHGRGAARVPARAPPPAAGVPLGALLRPGDRRPQAHVGDAGCGGGDLRDLGPDHAVLPVVPLLLPRRRGGRGARRGAQERRRHRRRDLRRPRAGHERPGGADDPGSERDHPDRRPDGRSPPRSSGSRAWAISC